LPRAPASLEVPIESKFHPPDARAEWVDRPELIGSLAGGTGALVLVDAPAGFGKTTLVAQWCFSPVERRPFAWISLDPADNDPGRLWWHVVCALERACPEFAAEDLRSALRGQDLQVTETVLPLLANALANLPAPVVIVLDDYHVIKDRGCHDQIAFLVHHLRPPVQLVLITRADPPLPLARMRVTGEMTEVRARELRFTAQEVATLVTSVSAAPLGERDLADLAERTEGWPAGVYLAALSLRGHPSPHAFVREFTGDNRFIVDFLADEVLNRQPREIQQFLRRTSILSRFCAPLCEAVSGSADAAEILDVLERENLFIVPLDDTREWYRYHHLFGQVLRSHLAHAEPGTEPGLHRRASEWHQRHGQADEAIGHAIAAGDPALAAELIASCWLAYVNCGQVATVLGWLRALGDDQIAATPLAAHCAAWAAALSGDRHSARRWLPTIDAGQHEEPLPDGMPSLMFSAALLRAFYGFEGVRMMRESAVLAAGIGGDPASPWHALAEAALGFSLYLSGDPSAAGPLEAAVRTEVSLPLTRIVSLSTLSLIEVETGDLPRARELMHSAYDLARRDDLATTPSAALAHVAAGAVHAADGRLDDARGELEQARRSRSVISGISPWPTLEATLQLMPVLLDLGDRAGAARLAREARGVLTALPDGAQAQLARLEALERRLATPKQAAAGAERLTERELTVLRLLGGTLSLREIGQHLLVSANTVKTHTQAIYRKLGVSTRHDAVEQARKMGML
jgi:LuxR family maltose regulon positive regulatory protein